jgi:methyl-accepting chemotaxis protein
MMFKLKKLQLHTKLSLSFFVVTTVVAALFMTVLNLYFRQVMHQQIKEKLADIASITAADINGDDHALLTNGPDAENEVIHDQIQAIENRIMNAASRINSIYTMRKNSKGQILFIVSSDDEGYADMGWGYEEPTDLLMENFDTLDQTLVEDEFYTDEYGNWLSSYAPLYRSDGSLEAVIGVDISVTDALAVERRLLFISLLIFVATIPLVYLVSNIVSRQIARPICNVTAAAVQIAGADLPMFTRAMTEIAGGNLDQKMLQLETKLLEVNTQDEIGYLAQSLNEIMKGLNTSVGAFEQMRESLKHIVIQLRDESAQLNLTSGVLAAAAEQSGEKADDVTSNLSNVAETTRDQAHNMEQAARLVDEMAGMVDNIASGSQQQAEAVQATADLTNQISQEIQAITQAIHQVADASLEAARLAEEGSATVAATIQSMQAMGQNVQASAQQITEMDGRSDQIGSIVDTIEEIASQTNLLALNAAIESARAGEHGKGFAVVADEVRKLSERSSQATRQIADLIGQIRSGISSTADAMRVNARQVQEGMQKAGASGEALEQILKAARAVSQQAEQVNQSARQVGSAADRLVQSSEAVSSVVEENTAASQTMAASSSQAMQSVQSVAQMAQDNQGAIIYINENAVELKNQVKDTVEVARALEEMASNLQGLVSAFQLNDRETRET